MKTTAAGNLRATRDYVGLMGTRSTGHRFEPFHSKEFSVTKDDVIDGGHDVRRSHGLVFFTVGNGYRVAAPGDLFTDVGAQS